MPCFKPQETSDCFESLSCSVVSDPLRPHGLEPTSLLCPWDSPGKNPGVGCHSLLQGIFLIQGSNPGVLHCRPCLGGREAMKTVSQC